MSLVPVGAALARVATAPPARIVHIGLGAFSRSHIAWYTDRAKDAAQWGISAYAGRSGALAEALSRQDCVYTLIERSGEGDRPVVVSSIVAAHRGDDQEALLNDLSSSETAIVTLTITEAGYRTRADGSPDDNDSAVLSDIAALHRAAQGKASAVDLRLQTALGRLVVAMEARRVRGSGPLALVCCDNIPENGEYVRSALLALARHLPEAGQWIESNVSFVSTSVDRITPRLDADEERTLRERYDDAAPVVAEPFSDWVLSGSFPAGRPAWETAGARFVDDLHPWEARKLWMLNGAHTLLASLGILRGHEHVAQAIADPVCRAAVEAFWEEAAAHLPSDVDTASYRVALVDRFCNRRIVHRLTQIAEGASTKIRLRVIPVAERERAAGRSADGCAMALASWIAAAGETSESAETLVKSVSDALGADKAFIARVGHLVSDARELTLR